MSRAAKFVDGEPSGEHQGFACEFGFRLLGYGIVALHIADLLRQCDRRHAADRPDHRRHFGVEMPSTDYRKQFAGGRITHSPTHGCRQRRDAERDDIKEDDARAKQVDRALADDDAERGRIDVSATMATPARTETPSGMSDLKYHR